jgi:hypothetical protein
MHVEPDEIYHIYKMYLAIVPVVNTEGCNPYAFPVLNQERIVSILLNVLRLLSRLTQNKLYVYNR